MTSPTPKRKTHETVRLNLPVEVVEELRGWRDEVYPNLSLSQVTANFLRQAITYN